MKQSSFKFRIRGASKASKPVSATDSDKSFVEVAKVSGARARYFVIGAGTVFDVGGSHLMPVVLGSVTQDRAKIQQDFWSVGGDMKDVLRKQSKYLAS